jgi:hypothetical protein
MVNTLDQDQLSQIVAAVLNVLKVQGAASKDAAPQAKAGNSLEAKDRALVNGFRRRGIPLNEIVLMDRTDRSKPYTIKPFKQWLAEGRMVKKGEKSIRGLFHITQTSELPKPSAKLAPKGKAKPKAQPTLV